MNIADAKQQVKDTVEAYLTKDEDGMYAVAPAHQRPIFLLGAPGIGKTAIMEQIAQELEIGLVSYSMTHHTRQSALGLPLITHHDYRGFEYDASEYTMSEIIASMYDYMASTGLERGILFLDEINCVSETLYPSMLQFLQFKTFGRHRIPDDWVVVCAGNPPEYNKSVHEFDIVTLDRLRKVEVEPDYSAWKAYAQESGAHPAITTFLEVKKDNFYSVETKPGGKSFVTARGWSDLSEIITLFERLGKPVDLPLVSQFLQDNEIAERFALYYDLFNKYRSDYQVDCILDGTATPDIVERGRAAAFDERVALLGLLLDALIASMGEVLQREKVLVCVRDVLREAKPRLLGKTAATGGGPKRDGMCSVARGETTTTERTGADDEMMADSRARTDVAARGALAVFDELVAQREASLARAMKAGTATGAHSRVTRQATAFLKELRVVCERERATDGKAAFALVSERFQEEVSRLEPAACKVEQQLAHAFAFIDNTFEDDRELLVFTAELTARPTSAQFVSRFGSPSYYAHNEGIMVDANQQDLLTRIDALGLDGLDESNRQAGTVSEAASAMSGTTTAKAADAYGEELRAYYAGAQFEYGLPSLCKMTLPDDLMGKTVLDVGCRRGKGVFKLSERVGASGRAIGMDWSPTFIAEAKQRMERAWRDTGLPANNMEFHVAYPEDLSFAGIGDESVDVVFVNSVSNLFFDRVDAYREVFRVLKPGGVLINETVLADRERDEAVVEAARAIGNSVQAAPSKRAFEALLGRVGFGLVRYHAEASAQPSDGALPERPAETVSTEEVVRYTALVATVTKP